MEYPLDEDRLYILEKLYGERYDVELTWMSPDEFLSKVPHPITTLVPAIYDLGEKYFSKSSLKRITEEILSKSKLDPLILDYTRMWYGYPSHEGRHRAFVAKLLGIEKVPVLIIKEM